MLIAVGGCMTQQEGAAQRLRKKFPFVDIVFGTHNLDDFGALLARKAAQKRAVVEVPAHEGSVCEEDFSFRTSYPNAWGEYHVRLQQFLFLLHCSLCAGQGTQPRSGAYRTRGAGASRERVPRDNAARAERQLLCPCGRHVVSAVIAPYLRRAGEISVCGS